MNTSLNSNVFKLIVHEHPVVFFHLNALQSWLSLCKVRVFVKGMPNVGDNLHI